PLAAPRRSFPAIHSSSPVPSPAPIRPARPYAKTPPPAKSCADAQGPEITGAWSGTARKTIDWAGDDGPRNGLDQSDQASPPHVVIRRVAQGRRDRSSGPAGLADRSRAAGAHVRLDRGGGAASPDPAGDRRHR